MVFLDYCILFLILNPSIIEKELVVWSNSYPYCPTDYNQNLAKKKKNHDIG